jgi:putative RNA 2'-phosphotransferase
MKEIRKCHGRFYEGTNCPECSEKGDFILNSERRLAISKFLSGLLRHFPDEYNIEPNERGWVRTVEVLDACSEKYDWFSSEQVLGVVSTDPKGRFEVNNHNIRASYGHSIDSIRLEENNRVVPDNLYHGTSESNIESIKKQGLKPMNRQEVHLTDDKQEAIKIASRHSNNNILLKIDAEAMMNNNHDIVKRADIIYTTEFVPPKYIKIK